MKTTGLCRENNPGMAANLAKTYITTLQNDALTQAQKDELVSGNPFDANGRSSAVIPSTVATEQGGNAWILEYHPYYAWNGCSNQLLSLRYPDHFEVLEYYLCPSGTPQRRTKTITVHGQSSRVMAGLACSLWPVWVAGAYAELCHALRLSIKMRSVAHPSDLQTPKSIRRKDLQDCR